MYGTRDVAYDWTEAYTQILVKPLGFENGLTSPCLFYHRQRKIKVAVHGDDFVSEGVWKELLWMDEVLGKEFSIETEILGPDEGEVKELRVLNRVIGREKSGIVWEGNPRHAEIVVEQLAMLKSKPVTTPGAEKEAKAGTEGATSQLRRCQ